jgi:hypothetical protein
MEDLCKTLLNTYNTNVLDGLDKDLQEALQREAALKREAECSEQNPNPSGKKREILLKLINNHYDPLKIKPSAKFIGGPETLTVHYLSEYKKYIYIFGEQHIDIMDCDGFDSFDEEEDFTPIEDYLYKLITNTDVFIDIFAELHTYDKSGKYPTNYIPYVNMNGRIANLFKKFKKCLQKNTRHDEDCKLARIHYIDIRTETGKKKIKMSNIFWYADNIKLFISECESHENILEKIEEIKDKNENEDGYLYYFLSRQKFQKDDEILRIWNDMTIKHKSFWAQKELDTTSLGQRLRKEIKSKKYIKEMLSEIISNAEDDNKYKTYWKKMLTDNEFIKKENKRQVENPVLKDAILTFINTEMDEIVMRDKPILQECFQNILNYEYIYDHQLVTDINKSRELIGSLKTMFVDYYALLRIFTNFNMTDMEKAYTGATDQPPTANNIIIYAGDNHSARYRRFLESIGNVPIEKTGNFLDDTTLPENCINMSDITQPFFNK